MTKEQRHTCIECNHFFADRPGPTRYGICLNDPAFDPYIEDLLERGDFSRCQHLIDEKRIPTNHPACPDFDPAEIYGSMYEDDGDLFEGSGWRILESGLLDEILEVAPIHALADSPIGPLDPKERVKRLHEMPEHERQKLLGLLEYNSLKGDEKAGLTLLEWLRSLPEPGNSTEAEDRRCLLTAARASTKASEVARFIHEEFYRIRPSNRTRSWLNILLDKLRFLGCTEAEVYLEEMATNKKHFSYRWTRKFREALRDRWESRRDGYL